MYDGKRKKSLINLGIWSFFAVGLFFGSRYLINFAGSYISSEDLSTGIAMGIVVISFGFFSTDIFVGIIAGIISMVVMGLYLGIEPNILTFWGVTVGIGIGMSISIGVVSILFFNIPIKILIRFRNWLTPPDYPDC